MPMLPRRSATSHPVEPRHAHLRVRAASRRTCSCASSASSSRVASGIPAGCASSTAIASATTPAAATAAGVACVTIASNAGHDRSHLRAISVHDAGRRGAHDGACAEGSDTGLVPGHARQQAIDDGGDRVAGVAQVGLAPEPLRKRGRCVEPAVRTEVRANGRAVARRRRTARRCEGRRRRDGRAAIRAGGRGHCRTPPRRACPRSDRRARCPRPRPPARCPAVGRVRAGRARASPPRRSADRVPGCLPLSALLSTVPVRGISRFDSYYRVSVKLTQTSL